MNELREAISILPEETLSRLYQGSTAEECAEALSDYAIEVEAERDALQEHLKFLRSLVSDGAKEGFNPMVGDWVEKLFCSNGKTSKLIEGKGDE
jgi:hypothetical protein